MPWPRKELASERGLRKTALYDALDAKGANWGLKTGWERVNYFGDSALDGASRAAQHEAEHTWRRPQWLGAVGVEHSATRNSAALFDVSSFAKFEVQGRDAEQFLNRVCCNDVAVEPGTIVYTGMLLLLPLYFVRILLTIWLAPPHYTFIHIQNDCRYNCVHGNAQRCGWF